MPHATPSAPAPPVVHAVGGSIGSGLALLLLYPLERARIEMQSRAAISKEAVAEQEGGSSPPPGSDGGLGESAVKAIDSDDDDQAYMTGSEGEDDHDDNEEVARASPPVFSDESVEEAAGATHLSDESDSFELVTCSLDNSQTAAPRLSAPLSVALPSAAFSQEVERASNGFEDTKSEECSASWTVSSRDSPVDEQSRDAARIETLPVNTPPEREKNGIWDCILLLHKRGELYRGVKPVVTTLATTNFVFFYAHELMKRYSDEYHRRYASASKAGRSRSIGRSLLASSLAGVITVFVTNPLWVANLSIIQRSREQRQQPNQKPSSSKATLLSELRKIVREEGVGQLWNGTLTSLLLVSNPVIQHFAYQQLKANVLSRTKSGQSCPTSLSTLAPVEAFLIGAIAKAIATVVTYPLQIAQTLLRLQKKRQDGRGPQKTHEQAAYSGTIDCVLKLYREGGIGALYTGMDAKLLQTVLTAAFTFLTYEQMLSVVMKSYVTLFKIEE